MNKILTLTALFAVLFSTNIFAQGLSKGTILQELTEIKADDETMASQLSMLKGSSSKVFFTANKVLTEMDMMGGMMKISTLVNPNDQAGFMLFDMSMMGMKYKVNFDNMKDNTKEDTSKPDITYDESDTKEIAGYKCYKATVSSSNLPGGTIEVYITEDLKIDASVIQGVEADWLKGFPLEYNIKGPGIEMIYTTVEILDTVDTDAFDLDTEGFEEMSMEEFQSKMEAMGGMGF